VVVGCHGVLGVPEQLENLGVNLNRQGRGGENIGAGRRMGGMNNLGEDLQPAGAPHRGGQQEPPPIYYAGRGGFGLVHGGGTLGRGFGCGEPSSGPSCSG